MRANDEGNLTDHDHLKCGKEVYKRVYILDENGDYVYERRTIKRIEFNYTRAWYDGVSYQTAIEGYTKPEGVYRSRWASVENYTIDDMRTNNPQYGYLWREREVDLGMFAKYKLVVDYVYRDECTEGEKISKRNSDYRRIDLPCTPSLNAEYSRYHERVTKDDRALYNGEQRSSSRDELRSYVKEWNSGEEVEEDIRLTHQHRHNMGWWS